jgi:hypothetical protein
LFQVAGFDPAGGHDRRHRSDTAPPPNVKRQDIAKQTSRRRGDAYELKDPKPGQGI